MVFSQGKAPDKKPAKDGSQSGEPGCDWQRPKTNEFLGARLSCIHGEGAAMGAKPKSGENKGWAGTGNEEIKPDKTARELKNERQNNTQS